MSAPAPTEAAPSASFRRIRLTVHTDRGASDVNAIASLPLFRVLEWVQREQDQMPAGASSGKLAGAAPWTGRRVTTPVGSVLDVSATLDELQLSDGDELYWLSESGGPD